MKANFGILPELLPKVKNKRERYKAYAQRSLDDLNTTLSARDEPLLKSFENELEV